MDLETKRALKSLLVRSLVLFFGVAVVIAMVVVPMLRLPAWPKIDDEKRLVEDCHRLIATPENRKASPSEWPESIRKLKPKAVWVAAGERVEIVISLGGIGDPYSLAVFGLPEKAGRFSDERRKLHHTSNPLIFKLY